MERSKKKTEVTKKSWPAGLEEPPTQEGNAEANAELKGFMEKRQTSAQRENTSVQMRPRIQFG